MAKVSLEKYVDSNLLKIISTKFEKGQEKSQLDNLLEMLELEKYQNLRQIIIKILIEIKKNEFTQRIDKIKFVSNFVFNYHAQEKMDKSDLIKYTLVLINYYQQTVPIHTNILKI